MTLDFATAMADRLDPPRPNVDVFAALGFTPNPGPQTRFLDLPDNNLDVLFGGAAGGSKSLSLFVYALRACVRFPGLQAFWFRRTFPELEQSVLRTLMRYRYGAALGARWNAGKHELTIGQSILTFGHAKNVQEASALLSAEVNLLIIDERTTLPPDVVDLLYTRVRSGVEGVPCLGIRSGTNPGDIGHSRVLADYIDPTGHGEREIDPDANGRRRLFIQSLLRDTPQLGEEYRRNLQGMPEKLRKAYLDGDWSVFAGQVFDEWRYERHVIKPFPIPAEWTKYNGIDGGYRAPWAVLWGAEDPDGRLWVYRELYEAGVGESDQARKILEAERLGGDGHISVRYADDALWAVSGEGKASAVLYREQGVRLTKAGKGQGSRITRVQRTRTYLAEGPACAHHRSLGWPTCPLMHVFTVCENLIRTLPTLPHEKKGNVEDVDTKAEDHAYDALSYLLVNLGGGAEAWLAWAKRQAEAAAAARGEEPLEPVSAPPSLPVPDVAEDQPEAQPEPVPDLIPADPAAVLREARNAAHRVQQGSWQ